MKCRMFLLSVASLAEEVKKRIWINTKYMYSILADSLMPSNSRMNRFWLFPLMLCCWRGEGGFELLGRLMIMRLEIEEKKFFTLTSSHRVWWVLSVFGRSMINEDVHKIRIYIYNLYYMIFLWVHDEVSSSLWSMLCVACCWEERKKCHSNICIY